MKAVVAAIALCLFVSAADVYAQAPVPGPEHEKLAYWVGTWKVDVEVKDSPLGSAGREQWNFSFEWFPGRFHLVYRADLLGSENGKTELGLFGYDAESRSYFFYQIASDGMAFVFKVTRNEGVWLWTCERTVDGKPLSIRMTVTEESPKSFAYTTDASVGGAPWVRSQEARATRIK